MLTYSQVQVAAYTSDGGIYHPHCAREEFSALTVEKADAGLDNTGHLKPLIQYSLDEWRGEDSWSLAEERADEWERDHPALARLLGVADAPDFLLDSEVYPGQLPTIARDDEGQSLRVDRNRDRLLDRLSQRYFDSGLAGPTCDHCGEPVQ